MNADERRAAHTKKEQDRAALIEKVKELKDKGYSNAAIARGLSINESSVRSLLKKTD